MYGAFSRYEDQTKGDKSARLVKGLDKYDMILQAREYFSESLQ